MRAIFECLNDAFQLILRRPRQGERLKGGESGLRDQDSESLIRISDRDSTGTYIRFHTSMRTSAYACTCQTRPRPPSIRANRAIQPHYSARAYPSRSLLNHTRHTICYHFSHYHYYILFYPTPRAHPYAPIFRRCAQYLPVDHAVATIVPAPRCPRACCPVRTSRYVACHARRRCDGPCERVAFRVRIRMSTHAC